MMSVALLENVHVHLPLPGLAEKVILVKGDYQYWHYCCDACDDKGWGCGYRTLQTMCSWVVLQRRQSQCGGQRESRDHSSEKTACGDRLCCSGWDMSVIASGDVSNGVEAVGALTNTESKECASPLPTIDTNNMSSNPSISSVSCGYEDTTFPTLPDGGAGRKEKDQTYLSCDVPTLAKIQTALVQMGDKCGDFVGSRQWIGSYEVCLCLDFFYDVPCKIIHVSQGSELGKYMSTLEEHFRTVASPVMMGGDSDASSKGILGVCTEPAALLVLDPHYSGNTSTAAVIQEAGWIKWVLLQDFHQHSFYNLCLPQLAAAQL